MAIFINLVNYIMPLILLAFIRFEKLRKSNENLVKMIRYLNYNNWTLHFIIWFYRLFIYFLRIFIIQLISLGLTISFILADKDKHKCWENEVGQQMFSIAAVDYCFCFVDLFLKFLFKVIIRALHAQHEIQYDTAYYTMNSMFSQALIWLGIYFTPFIVLMQVMKLVIIFFVKSVSYTYHNFWYYLITNH